VLDGDAGPVETVIAYHERTKHHFHRFAASLGHLDWATQPNPFRRFDGADLIGLPLPATGRPLPYSQLYASGAVPPELLSVDSVSLFFRYALSLTAWKRFRDTTWSLRANPSSGNLHPTEGYAVLPAIAGLGDTAGVYHYAPKEHALERRAVVDAAAWTALIAPVPAGSFLLGLSSVHWREAWKYGERAFRYCQHDVGHALGALRLAAAALGWRLVLLPGVGDGTLSRLLGLDRHEDFGEAEREEPDLLALIAPELPSTASRVLNGAAWEGGVRWRGRANVLSPEHGIEWPVIEEVARAVRRAPGEGPTEDFSSCPTQADLFGTASRPGRLTAEQAILGRRSAVAMDGSTSIPCATFFHMLGRLVPTSGERSMPWDAIPWRPRIHLGIFVHRVDGLPPGLYALPRDPLQVTTLQSVMQQPGFRWARVPSCPDGLPLYLLHEGDCRRLAARVSCGQDIAGDGAFSLGMIADYTGSLATFGAPFYRNLFWEAGMVGQVLYLEAEEAGVRATGIGCYFDDGVHEAFGITSPGWQSLYHFTVGGPVDDARLTTLPAYNREPGQ
jgi:SagB-type dehydrogenase family enzyme